jgi:2-hydroxychromene-2-carboxylate isomerase
MTEPIDFYFDFASPYSYFIAEKLDEVGREYGRDIVWRPLILWAVLKVRDMPAPLEHPVKRSYLLHDMERSARFHDLPFKLPTRFPASSHVAARAFYWLQKAKPDAAKPFAHRVFREYFVNDIDVGGASDIARCLVEVAGVGEDAAQMALTDGSAKAALQACVESAVTKGVWGVPYVLIGDEAFFGADRLPQIERHLRGRAMSAAQSTADSRVR